MQYPQKVTRPSEIYTDPNAKVSIQGYLNDGYTIIDFRPPTFGDKWISAPGAREITSWDAIHKECPPRFIVKKPVFTEQQLEDFWE